jgi:hypothetical protein
MLLECHVLCLLVLDIGLDQLFISAYRRYVVAPRPKIFTIEISLPASKLPCYANCALPFDETYYLRYRKLWRYCDIRMHVIHRHMPFQYSSLFLFGKLMEYFPKIFLDRSEHCLSPVFWNPYYVILAIPTAVT